MSSVSSNVLLACTLAAFPLGCGTEPADPAADASTSSAPLTLSRDIQPILDEYCVTCHAYGAGDPHGNPHFTPDSSARSFRESSDCTSGGTRVRLVVPGKPEESFVLYKLGAETALTITGTPCEQKMPFEAETPLAESDPAALARIRQWIIDGAQ